MNQSIGKGILFFWYRQVYTSYILLCGDIHLSKLFAKRGKVNHTNQTNKKIWKIWKDLKDFCAKRTPFLSRLRLLKEQSLWFVWFVWLPPFGQWVFDKSRVRYIKTGNISKIKRHSTFFWRSKVWTTKKDSLLLYKQKPLFILLLCISLFAINGYR